jgi:hypothetical protein
MILYLTFFENDQLEPQQHYGDDWWYAHLGCLVQLALVAGINISFDVLLECWPPESVSEGIACRIKTFVP